MGVSVFFSTAAHSSEAMPTTGLAVGLAPAPLDLKVHHNFGLLAEGREPLPEKVSTFLTVALGIWITDRLARRQDAPDGWTRRLTVSCPAPGWNAALAELTPLVSFLTGDVWSLMARPEPASLALPDPRVGAWHPDCICLFSGGLDSLAGAIDLLESGRRVLLVSHYDFGQLAGCQNYLTDALSQVYSRDRVQRWGFRVQFEAPELSLRSRSLLFVALGLAAASVWDSPLPLIIPENGWISLNPPLTGNRLGSYSTRTTHPYFLKGLQDWLQAAAIHLPLHNPYQYLTKGEVLIHCRNQDLLRRLLPHSLSCAHPVASRWLKDRQGNCGYCYPCLVRRAAAHAAGWDDGRHYLVDVRQQPEVMAGRAKGADWRSTLYCLQTWTKQPAPQRLLWQTGPLPVALEEQQRLVGVVSRGVEEIKQWVGKSK